MRVLVTGGAGYIGSHAVRAALDAGHAVTVLDDLSTGHREAVDPRARFVEGSLHDPAAVDAALEGCGAVMHFAAFSIVSESCREPLKYWRNNVGGSIALLEGMRRAGVLRLVFSSTAATYGLAATIPIVETTPQQPINPYGWTKLAVESLIRDHADAEAGFAFAILRYFNVAGCAWGLGEAHHPETHLVPILLQAALGQRASVSIFGTDYDTPDGTCIRDYVHVRDLVDAHVTVLGRLADGERRVYNVGSGRGWSVREVVDAARRVSGVDFEVGVGPRREGDPPALVTDPTRIRSELAWASRHSGLDQILADHWAWMREHPRGYVTEAG
ncbi:MAG: UDP-glucose 4-epimerase GalE [Alphaproteobacteria bacterium]|nr:UDP-glucose 4-epimerase GalE [Alphaproteobacteria bacterium]